MSEMPAAVALVHEVSQDLEALHIDYLVVLQNSWSPVYAGRVWPRNSWLRALERSRSGRRLRMLNETAKSSLWYDNSTPICGPTAKSKVPADLAHLRHLVDVLDPRGVVALGNQAADAVEQLRLRRPVLKCPHPASRTLTHELYLRAGTMLAEGWKGYVELRQERGRVRCMKPRKAA